jgi:Txe/YoeB family toxin of toxin-antitoxin system
LVTWSLIYTKQAQKDARKLATSGFKAKARELLDILPQDPFKCPPPFEKLLGDLNGNYSRRINIQHRLVYQQHTPTGPPAGSWSGSACPPLPARSVAEPWRQCARTAGSDREPAS